MSYSKLLPSFTFEVLCYLNRDQIERFSIVCSSLKNLIDRYFHSTPYRIFDRLEIRGGSYSLYHNRVYWHPNRKDYSIQKFLAGQRCNDAWNDRAYYSFAKIRPYLGPSVRTKWMAIYVAGDSIYNPEHIAEMESIACLWRDGKISIWNARNDSRQIVAEDFQPILNSPTILQCRILIMGKTLFSFKDYKILSALNIIENWYGDEVVDLNYWLEFLEQPGVKPVIVFCCIRHESVNYLLDQLSKDFASAASPNVFKIAFVEYKRSLTEFRVTNDTSGEKLELKKKLPVECQNKYLEKYHNYMLERSSI